MFSQQVFMLFGLPDPNQYDNANLTTHGEIRVLHIDQGVWPSVLPSCDPGGAAGVPERPVPREGATVISSRTKLASGGLDSLGTIVFGGRDKDGIYLNGVWLLRAANVTTQTSNQTDWGTEYGDGVLQSGKFQNARGVTVEVRGAVCEALCSTECSMVQFLDQCSVNKNITTPTFSGSLNDPSNTSGGGSSSNFIASQYDTSAVHKSLASASVVAILPALVLFKLTQRPCPWPFNPPHAAPHLWNCRRCRFCYLHHHPLLHTLHHLVPTPYSQTCRRTESSLPQPHGIAGINIFTLMYFVLPLCVAIVFAQDYHEEHPRRHLRVSNSSSAEAEYTGDPNPPPARPP